MLWRSELAALGASDKGAKVAVIEKMDEAGFTKDSWHFLGEDIGHVNSKWLISRGYGPYDTGEIVAEFVKRAAGRCNPEIIRSIGMAMTHGWLAGKFAAES